MNAFKKNTLPDLAFIDVETTGLDDTKNVVIEIAVTRVPPNPAEWHKVVDKACYRFTPLSNDVAEAEPKAFETNGFYVGHPDWAEAPLRDSVAAGESWAHVKEILKDASLVSQNVPFDRGFIWQALLGRNMLYNHPKYGLQPPWARRFVDIQSYSCLIAMQKGMIKWGLHDVYEALQLPKLTEHRAEADVLRGMAVMKHVYDRFLTGY